MAVIGSYQRNTGLFANMAKIAIDDDRPADAFLLEIKERLFRHLAGAEHEHLLVVETLEDLLLKTVDETMKQIFKEAGIPVIYSFLETNNGLKQEEIAEKPDIFYYFIFEFEDIVYFFKFISY